MSHTSARGSSGPLIVALLSLVASLASAFALAELARDVAPDPWTALSASFAAKPLWTALPIAGPLVVAILALVLRPRAESEPALAAAEQAPPPEPRAPRPAPPSPAAGLRLLATLQEEARLIDFVREDIEGYSDAQIGGAVRGIHAALRKALDTRLTLEPILAGEDGDPIEVQAGFAAEQIRVTGSPSGGPPYRGTLRHGGWRAREVRLPLPVEGSDPTILAPAEVEVG
jgi:hypothetical protein